MVVLSSRSEDEETVPDDGLPWLVQSSLVLGGSRTFGLQLKPDLHAVTGSVELQNHNDWRNSE